MVDFAEGWVVTRSMSLTDIVFLDGFSLEAMGVAEGRGVAIDDCGLAPVGNSADAAGVIVRSGVAVGSGSSKKTRITPWRTALNTTVRTGGKARKITMATAATMTAQVNDRERRRGGADFVVNCCLTSPAMLGVGG
jgi:hypothetical protein